ncbi:MAG: hypothetical protein JO126_02490 [Alphaproteobacteria bacterium]|nr:hypothetical protein [Alphaproteobacteria bacterium]MBV8548308.1 hypothetical protein [Alphaproteobacteria bacterium]
MQIDIRVLELLSSKICHDLVSPVSAINNGVELIEDIGGSVIDEAMKLISDSAGNASRRLRLFRMAYGRAGSEGVIPVKEVRQTAEQYLAHSKTRMTWADNAIPDAAAENKGFLKVVLNLLMLVDELLPYGGEVIVNPTDTLDLMGCSLSITGKSITYTPQIHDALYQQVAIDDLTPRTVQAYVTGIFATHFGFSLASNKAADDKLDLSLSCIRLAAAS